MPTTPEWEYCHLGAPAAGGVVVGLDAHDADTNIRHILVTAEPRALFLADSAQLARIAPLLPRPPALVIARAVRAALQREKSVEGTRRRELGPVARAEDGAWRGGIARVLPRSGTPVPDRARGPGCSRGVPAPERASVAPRIARIGAAASLGEAWTV